MNFLKEKMKMKKNEKIFVKQYANLIIMLLKRNA